MRLLGIIYFLTVLFFPFISFAAEKEQLCDSVLTNDLLLCASNKLKNSDDMLNKNYQIALASHKIDKFELKNVQLTWLRFRDEYCQEIYDDTNPGNEASIEKNLCLSLLTSDRAIEIERLYENPVKDDYFYKSLRSLSRAGYDRKELIDKLQKSNSENKLWLAYVSKNCKMDIKVSKDSFKNCIARNNFQRSY